MCSFTFTAPNIFPRPLHVSRHNWMVMNLEYCVSEASPLNFAHPVLPESENITLMQRWILWNVCLPWGESFHGEFAKHVAVSVEMQFPSETVRSSHTTLLILWKNPLKDCKFIVYDTYTHLYVPPSEKIV